MVRLGQMTGGTTQVMYMSFSFYVNDTSKADDENEKVIPTIQQALEPMP
jgi:hypothetical protein